MSPIVAAENVPKVYASFAEFAPEFPTTFYKYRRWSDVNHQRMLRSKEIYFASGNDFNDPFDCTISLRHDRLDDMEMRRRIRGHVRKQHPEMDRKQACMLADRVFAEKLWKNPAHLEYVQRQITDAIGIYSASARRDSILMWSHYADSHKGFCIGCSTANFFEFCGTRPRANNGPIIVVGRTVEYCDEYPLVVPTAPPSGDYVYEPMRKKAKEWEYERELRFFVTIGGSRFSLRRPPKVFTEVIFGCEMKEEHKTEIKQVLSVNMPHVTLSQAVRRKTAFALDFQEVTYS